VREEGDQRTHKLENPVLAKVLETLRKKGCQEGKKNFLGKDGPRVNAEKGDGDLPSSAAVKQQNSYPWIGTCWQNSSIRQEGSSIQNQGRGERGSKARIK